MCVISMGFYIVNYSVDSLPGNLLQNTLSLQVAEFSADVISGFIFACLGPKKSFILSFIISLLGSALLIALKQNESMVVKFIVVYLSKFGVSATFVFIFIASVKLIPAMYNTQAFGYANTMGRTLTVLAPLIAQIDFPIPMYVAIGLYTIGIFLTLILYEELPKTI